MKLNFDTKKGVEVVSNLAKGTADLGKKLADTAKTNITSTMEKSKENSYARRLKKFNPVFPEQYMSEDFNLPNMIMIVDDAERRGIDVCEGAIGWLDKKSGVEILCLYDEEIEFSGVEFVPTATCDAMYYVDSFNRNRFIRLDCIFSKAHEERLAELKHIAYSLGAKSCSIEIIEANIDSKSRSTKIVATETLKGINANESAEQEYEKSGSDERSGCIKIEFKGSDNPQKPQLKWFAYDDNINRLIEMRCSDVNSVKTETLELSGSTSATMSQKTAYAIDCAMSAANGGYSMSSQATKEHHSKLKFNIEF